VTWVFLLKHKFEVSYAFIQFVTMIKNMFGVNIKRIKSNNANKYFILEFDSFFPKRGDNP